MASKLNSRRRLLRFKRSLAKAIRILSVAPIMALIVFSVMYLFCDVFSGIGEYISAIIFIVLIPISAYPLQPIIPHFKNKGREGQRTLAMILSVTGYLLGFIYALVFSVSDTLFTIFATYLLSGILIFVFNKLLHFRASGHACGAAGPIGVLIHSIGLTATGALTAVIGILVLCSVFWATLKTHSHTTAQFIVGGLIPIILYYTLTLI
ncbi:MAG: hypothetical protein IJ499_03845 [Clostridia bacterium]|nr:hypothetical protein [Clostridia bacterium]